MNTDHFAELTINGKTYTVAVVHVETPSGENEELKLPDIVIVRLHHRDEVA